MHTETQLSVILPSFQEGDNLRLLLPRLKQAAARVMPNFEIVIVDTMQPKDDTPSICREFGARYVPRSGANSYGDAVRTGIAEARGEWTVFMDADGSHAPEDLVKLVEHASMFDIVIASRYVAGGKTENGLVLALMSRILNVIYSAVLKLDCRDVSNSFKLYHTKHLKAIQLRCQNFDIVEEILVKIQRILNSLRIKEVPITFQRRKTGKTKRNLLLFVVTYLVTLARLKWS